MLKIVINAMQWIFLLSCVASTLVAQIPSPASASTRTSTPATPYAPAAAPLTPASSTPAASAPASAASKQDEQELKESAKAAAQWLGLVDQGKYDESWSTASPRLQLIFFPKDTWSQYLNSVRRSLGRAQSRVMVQQNPVENPQGLAPGRYMVIAYTTTFPGQGDKQELLILGREDNQWRVLSYFIGTIK